MWISLTSQGLPYPIARRYFHIPSPLDSSCPRTSSTWLHDRAGTPRAGWAPAQVAASDLDMHLSVLRKRLVLDHLVPSLQVDTKLGGGGHGCNGSQRIYLTDSSSTVQLPYSYRTVPYNTVQMQHLQRDAVMTAFFNDCSPVCVSRPNLRVTLCEDEAGDSR